MESAVRARLAIAIDDLVHVRPTTFSGVDERAKELSRLYEEMSAQVKAIVDRADPAGLLSLGAPSDEYDDAVEEFTRRVLKGEPTDSKTVEDWFVEGYGIPRSLPGRDAPFREVARRLAQLALNARNDSTSGSQEP